MEKEVKRPIAKTLKDMDVNEVEMFPKFQYSSVNTTLRNIAYECDKKFTINRKPDGVKVTRTK